MIHYCVIMTFGLMTALAAFAFVSSITPGPNNLMLMASGANFGVLRTIPHMLGVGIGFAVMIVLVGAGVIQLFDAFPVSYTILKTGSVAYLTYLAWKLATAAPIENADKSTSENTRPLTFIQAALFQWVNPKAWAMALTAISAYTTPTAPVLSLLLVALVFGVINLPSVSAWTLVGSQLRRFLSDPVKLRVFNVSCSLLLLATLYPIFRAV